jgi:hypothetical protein
MLSLNTQQQQNIQERCFMIKNKRGSTPISYKCSWQGKQALMHFPFTTHSEFHLSCIIKAHTLLAPDWYLNPSCKVYLTSWPQLSCRVSHSVSSTVRIWPKLLNWLGRLADRLVDRYFIAEPLGLATLENLDFGLIFATCTNKFSHTTLVIAKLKSKGNRTRNRNK